MVGAHGPRTARKIGHELVIYQLPRTNDQIHKYKGLAFPKHFRHNLVLVNPIFVLGGEVKQGV